MHLLTFPRPPAQQVVTEDVPAPLTTDPLVVLVNENSASASEILSGALHDSHRATLVGSITYGKGKIQSVYELHDGSALFVTVAKYQTPLGLEIDHKGIQPDSACGKAAAAPPSRGRGSARQPQSGEQVLLLDEQDEEAALGKDGCVFTAEELLHRAHGQAA